MPIYISKALKAKKLVGLVRAANKGPEKTKLIQKKNIMIDQEKKKLYRFSTLSESECTFMLISK